jgi:hypothetical protein
MVSEHRTVGFAGDLSQSWDLHCSPFGNGGLAIGGGQSTNNSCQCLTLRVNQRPKFSRLHGDPDALFELSMPVG